MVTVPAYRAGLTAEPPSFLAAAASISQDCEISTSIDGEARSEHAPRPTHIDPEIKDLAPWLATTASSNPLQSMRDSSVSPFPEMSMTPKGPTPMRSLAILLLAAAACSNWVDVVHPEDNQSPVDIADSTKTRHIFVVFHGSLPDQKRLQEALSIMLDTLQNPALEYFITTHITLLESGDRAMIERTRLDAYLAPWSLGSPTFHVVPAELNPPGISEICVGGQPGTRAVGVDRTKRLQAAPSSQTTALLINTLAHETVHLYPLDPTNKRCRDRFNDRDSPIKQCHELTYVVGNTAACSFLSHQDGTFDWQQCMIAQANNTPGYQRAGTRDAFGCSPLP